MVGGWGKVTCIGYVGEFVGNPLLNSRSIVEQTDKQQDKQKLSGIGSLGLIPSVFEYLGHEIFCEDPFPLS
jgi:hypothetical protein